MPLLPPGMDRNTHCDDDYDDVGAGSLYHSDYFVESQDGLNGEEKRRKKLIIVTVWGRNKFIYSRNPTLLQFNSFRGEYLCYKISPSAQGMGLNLILISPASEDRPQKLGSCFSLWLPMQQNEPKPRQIQAQRSTTQRSDDDCCPDGQPCVSIRLWFEALFTFVEWGDRSIHFCLDWKVRNE